MSGRRAAALIIVGAPLLAAAIVLAGVNAVLTEIERIDGW